MNKVLNAISLAASVGSVIYILWERKNTKTTIDKVVHDIAEGADELVVSEEIMQAAAEQAAEKAAEKAASNIKSGIFNKIEEALDETRKENEAKIAEEYAKRAAEQIDIDTIKQEIEVKASKMVVNKMLSKIDDYSSSIVNKIYSQSF